MEKFLAALIAAFAVPVLFLLALMACSDRYEPWFRICVGAADIVFYLALRKLVSWLQKLAEVEH